MEDKKPGDCPVQIADKVLAITGGDFL